MSSIDIYTLPHVKQLAREKVLYTAWGAQLGAL